MDDQQWTLVDTEVTIVNRKKSYQIPKQKLSSIPYFMKLFSDSNCDTNNIEVDLDESSFDNIIDFILNDHLSISMESAFSMIETANYLGMEELKQKYFDFYRSNFNIKRLEEYLDFYESHKYPEIFTEEELNSFIEKYFLPISRTKTFLKFSVSLLERILKLNLVVSNEYEVVEAINKWIGIDENNPWMDKKRGREQYLPQLLKLVNFCHLKNGEVRNITSKLENCGSNIYALQLNVHSFHACHPKLCGSDCKSTRHFCKPLIAVYELDENTIEIRRLTGPNFWSENGRFARDETISTSLIVADHIFDIIYDSGRKGIRVDWIAKKFKYLKMFGDDNSYYDQIHNYITHDSIRFGGFTSFKHSKMRPEFGGSLFVSRVESISLNNGFICYGKDFPSDSYVSGPHIYPATKDTRYKQKYYYVFYIDYRKLSSCMFQQPVQTRSCDIYNIDVNENPTKVMYLLTKHDFSCHFSSKSEKFDYSFLKSFIGNDSLDHIELISHNNLILICNKRTKMIYFYVYATDSWNLVSKIESAEKLITIASINLPIDSE